MPKLTIFNKHYAIFSYSIKQINNIVGMYSA